MVFRIFKIQYLWVKRFWTSKEKNLLKRVSGSSPFVNEVHDDIGKTLWTDLLVRLNSSKEELTVKFSITLGSSVKIVHYSGGLWPNEVDLKSANYCYLLQKDSKLFAFPFYSSNKVHVHLIPFVIQFDDNIENELINYGYKTFLAKPEDLSHDPLKTQLTLIDNSKEIQFILGKKILLPTRA